MKTHNNQRRDILEENQVSSPADLPAILAKDAATLEEYGAIEAAKSVRRCAEKFELALNCRDDEPVSLTKAARARGYTPDHVGRLVRQGKLKNYGRPKAPRVRLSELPRKPGTLPSVSRTTHLVGATCRELARAVASEGGE